MKIYDNEKSIADLMQNNRVVSAISAVFSDPEIDTSELVNICKGDACPCSNTKTIAADSSADTMPISSILVTDIWNANHDVFCFEEILKAKETPKFKPINWMHRGSEETKNETIGVMVETSLVRGGLDSLSYFSDSELENYSQSSNYTISGDMHIRQDGVIWSQYFPTYAGKVEKGIKDGTLFVSMECFFDDFDYVLREDDTSTDYLIVKRNLASSNMSKSLKQYGGKGKVTHKGKEYQLGRLLKNITFSGQGVVKDPANKKDGKVLSVILNDIKKSRGQLTTNKDPLIKVRQYRQMEGDPPLDQTDPAAQDDLLNQLNPSAPQQEETEETKNLPTTYIAPTEYLYNTAEEATWVAENELGCSGYHVYLEDRHSEDPLLTAALLGDPTDVEKQSMRPKFLPCGKHNEFLLLTQEEDSGLPGGGGDMGELDSAGKPVPTVGPSGNYTSGPVGIGGVVLTAENWDTLKDNLITLSEKLSVKQKSGYKDLEVNDNMPEKDKQEEMQVALLARVSELESKLSSLHDDKMGLEASLDEAASAIEEAAAYIEDNKVDVNRLNDLEVFAVEADSIINEIELDNLGQSRLSMMKDLVGDTYSDNDVSELAKMDESTFSHVYESMTKVVQKIETAASKVAEREIKEPTEDEIKNALAGVVGQLNSSEQPNLVVKAVKNDYRNAARNLIRNAIQR